MKIKDEQSDDKEIISKPVKKKKQQKNQKFTDLTLEDDSAEEIERNDSPKPVTSEN